MLVQVKAIANKAIKKIDNQLNLINSDNERKQLTTLKEVYVDLMSLIEHAEKQQASLGLWVLSSQLTKNSKNLTAEQLASNFIDIVAIEKKWFYMNKKSWLYDLAKQFSHMYLYYTIIGIVMNQLPIFILWGCSPLYLIAPLILPLLAVSLVHWLADPYSMIQAYQELMNIESSIMHWMEVNAAVVTLQLIIIKLLLPTFAVLQGIVAVASALTVAGWLGVHKEILNDKVKVIKDDMDFIGSKQFSSFNYSKEAKNSFFKLPKVAACLMDEMSPIDEMAMSY